MICSFPCRFRIEASKSSISAVAENPNCDARWALTPLMVMTVSVLIHIRVQRCLRECALVTVAVKLLGTGEGTIRRILTLSKHFDDLIFFTQ